MVINLQIEFAGLGFYEPDTVQVQTFAQDVELNTMDTDRPNWD